MQVRDIMTGSVITVDPTAPAGEAARLMRDNDIGALPVQQAGGGGIQGMVTDRDIAVRSVAMRLDPEITPVEEIMTRELVYCYDDDDITGAARAMEDRQVKRILVYGREDDQLKGILSLGDLSVRTDDQQVPAVALHEVSERREAA